MSSPNAVPPLSPDSERAFDGVCGDGHGRHGHHGGGRAHRGPASEAGVNDFFAMTDRPRGGRGPGRGAGRGPQDSDADFVTMTDRPRRGRGPGAAAQGPSQPGPGAWGPGPFGPGEFPDGNPGNPDESGRGRGRGRGAGRGRGPRPRRGDVRRAVLRLLAEQPMHGYQIITELAERSGGAWQASPGSIYPTLQALADEGLVTAADSDGRRVFSLTELGRTLGSEHSDRGHEPPWAAMARGVGGAAAQIREAVGPLMGAAAQVAQVGTEQQIARALEVLADSRRSLYRILAEDDLDPAADDDIAPVAEDAATQSD